MFPALVLGVCSAEARIFWRWQDSPYRDEMYDRLDGPIVLYLFLLPVAVAGGAIASVAPILTYQQSSEHPCLCFSDQRGKDWVNLVLGGGEGAFMLIAALFVFILALYRLAHWRQPPTYERSDDGS